MKKLIYAICVLVITAGLTLAADAADLEVVHKIRREALEQSKVMEHLFYLTDVHGPRLTGSPALLGAAEWVVGKLKEWGGVNVGLEPWGPFGRGWSYSKFEMHITAPQYQPVIGFPLAWTPGTNGPVSGELILAPMEKKEDFEAWKGKLRGKIVLLSRPKEVKPIEQAPARYLSARDLDEIADARIPRAPVMFEFPRPAEEPSWEARRQFTKERAKFLSEEGVLAVITLPYNGDGGTVFAAAGGSREVGDPVPPPMVAITPEHYNRIARLMAKKIPVSVTMNVEARFHDENLDSFTVVGEIPGTSKKDEIVMMGGHLDSWHGATGATDNAAGCAVAMEAFRILKSLDVKMPRTVRIALWTGEEQGLLGSRAYVKQHFADPEDMVLKPEHGKLSAYFNLDNGGGKIRGIYLQGNDMLRPVFEAWLKPFHDLGATTVSIRNTGGTDHLSFDAVGLPGFQFIQDPVEYSTRTHHSNMDTFDRIPAENLMQASAIMASFVYHTAVREEKLPRKPLPKAKPRAPRPEASKPAGTPSGT